MQYFHSIAYAAMSATYAGTLAGIDKDMVGLVVAAIYLALAIEGALRGRH